jgi:hypothetical protein
MVHKLLLSLAVFSMRDTILSFVWVGVLLCSVCFLISATSGLLFKSPGMVACGPRFHCR